MNLSLIHRFMTFHLHDYDLNYSLITLVVLIHALNWSSDVKLSESLCASSVSSSRCFLSNQHRLTFKPAASLETVRAANHLLTCGSTSLHVLCVVLLRRTDNESSGCSRGRDRAGPDRTGPGRSDTKLNPDGLDVELVTDVSSWTHPAGGLSRYCGD